tara:strand:+ start:1066 stop:1404 length:339 start_codon:yes stop_codon:yes gene_type:complete
MPIDLTDKEFEALRVQSENMMRRLYEMYQEAKRMGDVLNIREVFLAPQFLALPQDERDAFVRGFALTFHFSRNLMEATLPMIDPVAHTDQPETFRGKDAAADFLPGKNFIHP